MRATEGLLQVGGLESDGRARIVRTEYAFETQDKCVDADTRGTCFLALHHGPRMSQEARRQPRIASCQFAIDRQRVAHDRHFTSPGFVAASDNLVPGLQQGPRCPAGGRFPDQAFDMQRPLAHRLALQTLRRRCPQCAIDGGRE